MLPTSQYVFPGFLAPNAPADMIAGLGKNGQILSIAKSKGIVFVRMGNQSGSMEVANQLCDQIWAKLNAVMCNENSVAEENPLPAVRLYPNPAGTEISVLGVGTKNALVDVFSLQGQLLISSQILLKIDISGLAKGIYLLRVTDGDTTRLLKFIKQ
jgi:hypothetical protein